MNFVFPSIVRQAEFQWNEILWSCRFVHKRLSVILCIALEPNYWRRRFHEFHLGFVKRGLLKLRYKSPTHHSNTDFSVSRFFADFITPMQPSAIAIILSFFFFIICCLIPESPRYTAFHDVQFKHTYDFEKAIKLHKLWSEEDLQRKSIVDLFNELKKLNLLSLIGLVLVEQFIGGISILFYMKHFAQLTGEWMAKRQSDRGVWKSLTFEPFTLPSSLGILSLANNIRTPPLWKW